LEIALGADVFTRATPIRGRSLLMRLRDDAFDPVVATECTAASDSYASEPDAAGYTTAVYEKDAKLIVMSDPWRVENREWPTNVALTETLRSGQRTWTNVKMGHDVAWLYDLAADPHEDHDRAAENGPAVARLKSRVADRLSC